MTNFVGINPRGNKIGSKEASKINALLLVGGLFSYADKVLGFGNSGVSDVPIFGTCVKAVQRTISWPIASVTTLTNVAKTLVHSGFGPVSSTKDGLQSPVFVFVSLFKILKNLKGGAPGDSILQTLPHVVGRGDK